MHKNHFKGGGSGIRPWDFPTYLLIASLTFLGVPFGRLV